MSRPVAVLIVLAVEVHDYLQSIDRSSHLRSIYQQSSECPSNSPTRLISDVVYRRLTCELSSGGDAGGVSLYRLEGIGNQFPIIPEIVDWQCWILPLDREDRFRTSVMKSNVC